MLIYFSIIFSLLLIGCNKQKTIAQVTPYERKPFIKKETKKTISKVALLIGNSKYTFFNSLDNPKNDVFSINKTLLNIGFKQENIILSLDSTKVQMLKKLNEFKRKSQNAKIAFVYFSGHGIQYAETNYMIPINAKRDITNFIALEELVISSAQANSSIILLDACRNTFINDLDSSFTKEGLTEVKTTTLKKNMSVLIGFATRLGEVALDGIGRNSPYAKSLSFYLNKKGDIRNILGSVSKDVLKSTKNKQEPIYRSTLGGLKVCLNSCPKQDEDIKKLKQRLNTLQQKLNSKEDKEKINKLNQELKQLQIKLKNNSNKIKKTPYKNEVKKLKIQIKELEEYERTKLKKGSTKIAFIGDNMYQTKLNKNYKTWEEANIYCENLELENYNDWELPSKKKLKKLILNNAIAKNSIILPNKENPIFWTSTQKSNPLYITTINFKNGETQWKNRKLKAFALCSR